MNKRLISPGLCTVIIFLFSTLSSPAEIDSQLQAVIERAGPQEAIPIIVTFAGEPDLKALPMEKQARRSRVVKTLREKAEKDQRHVRALLHARGKPFESLWVVNGLALQASPDLIATLAAQPQVEKIAFDAVTEVPEIIPADTEESEWNIQAVHAPELWGAGYTGQGVTIAILDSGVNLGHPDLAGRYRGGPAGWFDPYRQTSSPYDPIGHGTLVAGVAVGGDAGGSDIGVAPGAHWIAAKIFRDDGSADNSQIIKAFQWVLDPDGNPETNDAVADVVNNSWGFEEAPGICDTLFRPIILNLKAAGIAVVFSAGNTGPEAGVSPGNYPESFAVGATNRFSLLAPFSARGPSGCDKALFPEIVAPGVTIRSSEKSGYASVNGTSFSAPHVAGVMALLLSASPGLPPDELEEILKVSASDLGPAGSDNEYGYGMINAVAAFQQLNGTPQITVSDSAPPADDLMIDYGHVPPGQSASRTATVRNTGDGILQIGGIDKISAPFAILTDRCAGRTLGAGQTCTVDVRFAPGGLQTYEGALVVRSSDPDQGLTTLQLTGIGNTPPPAARLISPGNAASGVALPVTLEWTQVPDSDGDSVRHTILIAEREDFSDATAHLVAGGRGTTTVLFAGAGGLLILSMTLCRRRRKASGIFLCTAFLLLLVACGGGGSDDAPVQPQAEPMSDTVTDLAANTRYYWKVVCEDERGARMESEVFSFTTRP